MNPTKSVTFTAPALLASALVYGDDWHIRYDMRCEVANIRERLESENGGRIVSIRAVGINGYRNDWIDYVATVEVAQ